MRKVTEDLNARFSRKDEGPVIDYEELSSISLKDRLALYLAADVFLLTSIREGLNTYALEYIYARKKLDHAGVVICSEFFTCASLLNGSLKINPFYALECGFARLSTTNGSKEANNRRAASLFRKRASSALWTKPFSVICSIWTRREGKNEPKTNGRCRSCG